MRIEYRRKISVARIVSDLEFICLFSGGGGLINHKPIGSYFDLIFLKHAHLLPIQGTVTGQGRV